MQFYLGSRSWLWALGLAWMSGCHASGPASEPGSELGDEPPPKSGRREAATLMPTTTTPTPPAVAAGKDSAPAPAIDAGVAPDKSVDGSTGSDAGIGPAADARPQDVRPQDPTLLPLVVVNVGGKTLLRGTKIPGAIKVIEQHDGTADVARIDRWQATLTAPIGIEYRGNWSFQFPKKSFSIELRDGDGLDKELPILGMPAESDWVLYAPYTDKTLVRNAFGYWMWNAVMGRYSVRTRFVELVIDKQYLGVYVLVEKIKRGKNRVNIPKVAADATQGDITGSYIIRREAGGNGAGFRTTSGLVWDYSYPRGAEITTAQTQYIRDFTDRFEKAMAAPTFADPQAGYRRWIDVASWVDFAIFQELGRNTDGFKKSHYHQKLPDSMGGKFVLGPVWDLDLTYGNLTLNDTSKTAGWLYEINKFLQAPDINPPWWEKLMRDSGFANELKCRWTQLRTGPLQIAALHAQVDLLVGQLAAAQPRDNVRWKITGKKEWFHPFAGATYAEDVAYMKRWMADRMTWLDTQWRGPCR